MASNTLFMSLIVALLFIGGIIGQSLTPIENLATLPLTMLVFGTAVFIIPINKIMAKVGRKHVFLSVCIYTIIIINLLIISLYYKSFFFLCGAVFLLGLTTATVNQFRFAAIESVTSSKAISATATILLGGLISAFLGPELVILGKNYFATEFIGSFLLLESCFVIAFVLLHFFKTTEIVTTEKNKPSRPLSQIIKQPVFIVAMMSAAIGYIVMSYVMTATPLNMHILENFSLENTKFVIQSHVVAMFLPSLFTPIIVRFLGLTKMMLLGVLFYLVCVFIAYFYHQFIHYWLALVLLGLGWNFLFIGGTSLLPKSYQENEKFQVQGLNDLLIFGSQAIASFLAGLIIFAYGWQVLIVSIVPLLVIEIAILWRYLKIRI
jgi:MFS family permease